MIEAHLLDAVLLSLKVATVATVVSLPICVFIAFALARWHFPGKALLNLLVLLPLVLPPVVTGYFLLVAFGAQGPIGGFLSMFGITLAFRWTGAALAAALMAMPLTVRAIKLAIEAVDPKLEEAAETLGASKWRVFLTITLPLSAPGVLAGALMGFAKAIGEFGATITFVGNIPGETQTLPTAIYSFLQVPGGERDVLILVGISTLIAVAAVVISEALSRRIAARIGAHDAVA